MKATKISLVTGAAGGIGFAIATTLAQRGDRLILVDRNEQVHEVAAELRDLGLSADAVVIDLADSQGTLSFARQIAEQTGGIDILVNNAGIHPKVDGRIPAFEEIRVEDWEAVLRVNTTAPFLLCQCFVPFMKRKHWGRVVNIASRAGRTYSDRAGTHYSASKAAVIAITRKVAGDYGAFGVTANCIAPGQILTPLARKFSAEILGQIAQRIPARRLGEAGEIASAVAYLSSAEAGFINGIVMDVNGGETML